MKKLILVTVLVILIISFQVSAAPVPRLIIPRLGQAWNIGLLPWNNAIRTWPSATLDNGVDRLDMTGDFSPNTNTALAGHYTLADGSPGPFYNLDTLTLGDYVWVDTGQTVLVYQVGAIFNVQPDALWVTRTVANETILTLLTCDDYDSATNTYKERLVVWAFEVTNA